MGPSRTSLFIALLMICVGVGWLLSALGFMPVINWVWTLGLAMIGVLTIALIGWDKVTAVVGSFFILASILSVLRQTGNLTLNVEVPCLVIAAGVLTLVARLPVIPNPTWIIDVNPPEQAAHD